MFSDYIKEQLSQCGDALRVVSYAEYSGSHCKGMLSKLPQWLRRWRRIRAGKYGRFYQSRRCLGRKDKSMDQFIVISAVGHLFICLLALVDGGVMTGPGAAGK